MRCVGALALVILLRPSPARAENVGFIRDASGKFTTIDVPGSIATDVTARNNSGEAAGTYLNGHTQGFLRAATGANTTFDVPGSAGINVIALNDLGEVAGNYLVGGVPEPSSLVLLAMALPIVACCPCGGRSPVRSRSTALPAREHGDRPPLRLRCTLL